VLGAGLANSEWVRDQAHFEQLIDPRAPAPIRNRFMKGLGTGAAARWTAGRRRQRVSTRN
jgi:hypothetical protein